MKLKPFDALIIVDVQNDFLPGGALAVPDGDRVIPVLNEYAKKFVEAGLSVFATRDWHPENHCSFKAQGGIWPPHCIADTDGAKFASDLLLVNVSIISKAVYEDTDAYSGFSGTTLNSQLVDKKIKRLFIGGLATDYCVNDTVCDAVVRFGYTTYYLKDASRGVNIKPLDVSNAELKMVKSGAIIINSIKEIE